MTKPKIVYVALKPVFITDGRGNTKELAVGSEITANQWAKLKSDAARAKFERVEKAGGRVRFTGGLVTDLPAIDGIVKTVFTPDEFHLLPVSVRELLEEVVPLWQAAYPEVDFPGIECGVCNVDHHLAWFVWREGLPASLPPMYSTSNRPCRAVPRSQQRDGVYIYSTASLLKMAERLRGGRPVFAVGVGA